jgi:hypothetical protein
MSKEKYSEVIKTIKSFNFLENYFPEGNVILDMKIFDPQKKIKDFKGVNFNDSSSVNTRRYVLQRSFAFPIHAEKQRRINGKIEQLVQAAYGAINSSGITMASLEIIVKVGGKEVLKEQLTSKNYVGIFEVYSTEDFHQSSVKNYSSLEDSFKALDKEIHIHMLQAYWNISKMILEVNPDVEFIRFQKYSDEIQLFICSKKTDGLYEFEIKHERYAVTSMHKLSSYFRKDGKIAHTLFDTVETQGDVVCMDSTEFDSAWMDINTAFEKIDMFFSNSLETDEEFN